MSWGAFLLSMAGPVVVRAVVALGFTAVSFTGVTILVNELVVNSQSNWASIPNTVLQLASLSGIPEFLGLVFGAAVARAAMWASVGASRFILKS